MPEVWILRRSSAALRGFLAGSAVFFLVVGSFGPLLCSITGKKRVGG